MTDARLEILPTYKHIKLGGKNYSIYLEDIKLKEESPKFDRIHHIHILDRSGSMSDVIGKLMDNVKQVVETMGDKDLLSIIWFSGENESKILLKGAGKQDKESIDNLLDSIKSTIGCTCFSEPLGLANDIIEDLAALCPNFSVNLFTDGEPCVYGSLQAELDKIFLNINKMKAKVLSLNTIGYTRWADKELLTKMSNETAYGRYIFSEDINDYNEIFGNNYKRIQGLVACQYEAAEEGAEFFYRSANTFAYKKNQFSQFTSNEFQIAKLVSGTKQFDCKEMDDAVLENFLYQIAYEAYYRGNSEFALDCLCKIGDSYAVKAVTGAFSSSERAEVTKELLGMAYGKGRYKEGKNYKLEVSNTMFCVFDLLSLLKDEIYVPSNDYKRIGMKVADTNDIFELDKEQEFKGKFADNLVFASDRANVSIRYAMKGKVRLLATAANRVGLPERVDSIIYRTQTIIKDGDLNMETIGAYVSNNTLQKIRKRCNYYGLDYNALIHKSSNELYSDKTYVEFNLKALPIMNRRVADIASDFSQIAELIKQLNENKARMKILKSFIKDEVFNADGENYNKEQLQVLRDHGITKGVYGGIKKEIIASDDKITDFYFSRSLDFQQKGWSSLPKVEDVIKKDNPKPGTPAEFMKRAYESYKPIKDDKESVLKTIVSLKEEIFDLMDTLSVIRLYKMSIGGFWEDLKLVSEDKYEYTSEKDSNLVVTVKTTYVRKPYTITAVAESE